MFNQKPVSGGWGGGIVETRRASPTRNRVQSSRSAQTEYSALRLRFHSEAGKVVLDFDFSRSQLRNADIPSNNLNELATATKDVVLRV